MIEAASAGPGQGVELGLPAQLGRAPLGLDPALSLHPVESRVERTLLDCQRLVGRVLEPTRNRISMTRPPRERFEDQHIEGAREQLT